REAAVSVEAREAVRPGARNRPVQDRSRRVGRNRRSEDEREDHQEVATRSGELDRDRALLVVRDDPGDVPGLRRVLGIRLGPSDVGVEADALAGGEEAALDRPL